MSKETVLKKDVVIFSLVVLSWTSANGRKNLFQILYVGSIADVAGQAFRGLMKELA